MLPDGRLLVCDARRGLLCVDPDSGDVESLTQYVDTVPLRCYASATADGTIWFTEPTTRFDFEHYCGAFSNTTLPDGYCAAPPTAA